MLKGLNLQNDKDLSVPQTFHSLGNLNEQHRQVKTIRKHLHPGYVD